MVKDQVKKILVVDDEEEVGSNLSDFFEREGMKTHVAYNEESAFEIIRKENPDLILLDVRLPGIDGMEILKRVKSLDSDLPVVMMTAYAGVEQAVEAMKIGAHDYLEKPFKLQEVIRVVRRALTERELKQKIRHLSATIRGKGSLIEWMGTSDAVRKIDADVQRVASSDFNVIILGETGVGKELVAKAIHEASSRSDAPFIPIDCGAIPETLFESELFGHEKGAFTGADRQKPGKLEAAAGGTLFLDEVSNMPAASQVKLLRAIQEKTVYRVGSVSPIKVDIRFIAASNQDLTDTDKAPTFRRDLFYRLYEFMIRIPPLRERPDDILYLARQFLHATNVELDREAKGFSGDAVDLMMQYSWPGNVRELRSCVRRAVLTADVLITRNDLGIEMDQAVLPAVMEVKDGLTLKSGSLKDILKKHIETVEREILIKALRSAGGNKAKAARLLKIDYKTMHSKVKQYGIAEE